MEREGIGNEAPRDTTRMNLEMNEKLLMTLFESYSNDSQPRAKSGSCDILRVRTQQGHTTSYIALLARPQIQYDDGMVIRQAHALLAVHDLIFIGYSKNRKN